MAIRKSTIADVQQIVQDYFNIIHLLNEPYYGSQQLEAWIPRDSAEHTEKWEPVVAGDHAYVYEVDGRIVGFGAFETERGLLRLFATINAQNSGIEKRLLDYLLPEAKAAGIDYLVLVATPGEKEIFEQLGFDAQETHAQLFTHMMSKKI